MNHAAPTQPALNTHIDPTEAFLRQLHPTDGKGHPAMLVLGEATSWSRTQCTRNLTSNLPIFQEAGTYISVNAFHGKRGAKNLSELRAVYLDLDYHKLPAWRGKPVAEVERALLDHLDRKGVTEPSFVLRSGRGLYAIWLLKPLPPQATKRYLAAASALYETCAQFGADVASIDVARVFRLPGTVNPKSGRNVQISQASFERHDFDVLADQFFLSANRPTRGELRDRKRNPKPKPHRGNMPVGLTGPQRFAMLRSDLEQLAAIWGHSLPEGVRNNWLHLYATCLTHCGKPGEIAQEVEAMAQWLAPRLKSTEVQAIIRSAENKARGDWTEKYRYAGKTMADMLGVSASMARTHGFKQLLPVNERKRRKAAKEQERRKARGCQSREDWLADHSVSADKPWETLGVSRSTWYRRKQQGCLPEEARKPQATDGKENHVRQVRARNRGDLRSRGPHLSTYARQITRLNRTCPQRTRSRRPARPKPEQRRRQRRNESGRDTRTGVASFLPHALRTSRGTVEVSPQTPAQAESQNEKATETRTEGGRSNRPRGADLSGYVQPVPDRQIPRIASDADLHSPTR
ncbi:hypothetical protein R5H30_01165 [Sulfitobacter sp. D35]|uniref:DNA-primase RepB domain-containing protein n=1 Tax=Sulfitobacter sp. D35 TaxID=3083252 RepID=UPI00296E546C|nr:hypothetical protein [Sulfitobacter sp. D35]MDW4496574.1 hypothetical protein [Sulfitobacter sp. D35]